MEFDTVNGETWLKIDGLWQTEYGALAAALANLADANRERTFAASNVQLAEILTTPGHPDSGPFLRPLVLDRLALPANADDATILAVAGAAVPAAVDRITAATQALGGLREALIVYATERRAQAVAQRQFHVPELIPVFSRCVEVARQTWIMALVMKQGDALALARQAEYRQVESAWLAFLELNAARADA